MRLPYKKYLIIACTLFMTACFNNQNSSSETQEVAPETTSDANNATQNRKTYLVSTLSTFPPFIIRGEYGQTEGFDVDVLKAIGDKRGFDVKFLVTPWKGMFDTVTSGERDIISTALVITPERKQVLDFSNPYFTSGRMAVVTDPSLKSFEQLKGKRFVTQAGTSNVPILESFLGSKDNIVGVETQYQEIKELLAGNADVAFDDSGVMQYYVAIDKSHKLHGIPYNDYPGDEFGFAVKPGNTALLKEINEGLRAIKADGTYQKIYDKWFSAGK